MELTTVPGRQASHEDARAPPGPSSPLRSRAVRSTLLVADGGNRPPGTSATSQWVVAAAMGVLALGSWVWPVVVYRGGESEAFNMDEGFFVILALLVPPLVTLGTLALATVVAQAVRRRPLVKSAFNAGQVLIAAGLGLAVSRGYRRPRRIR